jgi:hypothetical protein
MLLNLTNGYTTTLTLEIPESDIWFFWNSYAKVAKTKKARY